MALPAVGIFLLLLFASFPFTSFPSTTLESATVSICENRIMTIGVKHIVHLNQVSA